MFEDPTIRGIARSLADGRVRTHALVAFAVPADDGRPRLFMMPGILSLPFHLRDMAAAVASEVVLVSAQLPGLLGDERPIATVEEQARSEERRVGKEGVSTCRSRWSPAP